MSTDDSTDQSKRVDAFVRAATVAARARVGPVRAVIRSYYSSYLLWTAQHLSELAGQIEAGHEGRSHFSIEHRGLVLSSVLDSAAFLEAAVNELYQDAVDGVGLGPGGHLSPLPSSTVSLMAEFWEATGEGSRLRPLDKYAMLLLFAGRPAMDRGGLPYQDAALVIRVRNEIAHYLPSDRAADIRYPLEALRGKFEPNRLMGGSGNAWWPDHALGYGCAAWAHRSVRAFVDHVSEELGLILNYRRVEDSGGFGQTPGHHAAAPEASP